MNTAESCLHDLFRAQAARTPDAPAIVSGHGQISYLQLVWCIRSSPHHSEAFRKDRELDSCSNQSNLSASIAPLFTNELQIHHTRRESGND